MRVRVPTLFVVMTAFCAALVARPGGTTADNTRTISLYNIHTKETVTSTYKRNGKYVPAEMEKINWVMRDWRKNESTKMEPELIDLLWEVHSELKSAEPIHIISGYRSRGTNEMLRKSVGGQASQSRHMLGKAADVHFPDVPVKNLRYSALVREKGGVGYYPTSAIPFVHLDTDRVRAWPRLPRAELALLFPSGRTQHLPADGGPITREDVIRARTTNKELAMQVAAFHQLRTSPRQPVQTASLSGGLPRLLSAPEPVDRPRGPASVLSQTDRAKLAALLSSDPLPRLVSPPAPATRRGQASNPLQVASYHPDEARTLTDAPLYRERHVVPAPEYDEEHPEELSYRPFPIAPFLTNTASADDPALSGLVHPQLGKILETMGHENVAPPMRLRPGVYAAERMWAQEFKGEAVDLSGLLDAEFAQAAASMSNRRVATQRP